MHSETQRRARGRSSPWMGRYASSVALARILACLRSWPYPAETLTARRSARPRQAWSARPVRGARRESLPIRCDSSASRTWALTIPMRLSGVRRSLRRRSQATRLRPSRCPSTCSGPRACLASCASTKASRPRSPSSCWSRPSGPGACASQTAVISTSCDKRASTSARAAW